MGAFNYLALDVSGKRKKGVIEADTARQVRQKLRDQGLMPIDVNEELELDGINSKRKMNAFRFLFRKSMSTTDLALVTRQLSTLLAAGIPLDETLTAVANQTEKPRVKSILLGVRSKVMEGHSLAAGMNDFPSAFPKLYRTTVASGEKSGQLDSILLKLAEYTEKQHDIKRKIRQALIYPALMTLVSSCVVVFLLIYVVPKIVDVFVQTRQTLPLVTSILIAISQEFRTNGFYFLIALVFAIIVFRKLLKKKRYRAPFDRFLLKLPILGKSIRTVNSARFGRTFGILNSAGVPVIEAMQTAMKLITPLPMRTAVENAIAQVREGSSIHRALQHARYFSPMFIHLVASGETSGQLDAMLQKAASQQEGDVEALINGALTLFEPVMILVMGSIVLFIVLAIMLPIFALDQMGGLL